jgi:cobyrinic acid a,c-diamide synthase
MSRVLISAAHRSSGKTLISIGLLAAFKKRGLCVQPFKKGPDYIDPLWLSAASGRKCYNLDFFTMVPDEIIALFARKAKNADFALIEGTKGLYDGLDLKGGDANAALAKTLSAPVILVVDTVGITRGIAPLVLGYQAFDPSVNIAGLILNKIASTRHEAKLRAAIEHYTTLPIIGAVQRDPLLEIPERHLGLTPENEITKADALVEQIRTLIESQVDIECLTDIAASAAPIQPLPPQQPETLQSCGLKIGVTRDKAFSFYYPDDLEAMERMGAKLVFIDALSQSQLPNVDALFLGGGFPETQAAALSKNRALLEEIRLRIEQGLPCYAECGGLMMLTRSLSWKGQTFPMANLIEGDAVIYDTPQGRGYVRLHETGAAPWPKIPGQTGDISAHEFHYSTLENLDEKTIFAYQVQRGAGLGKGRDGIVYRNLLASYTHLRHTQANPWVERFIRFIQNSKKQALRKDPE